MTKQNISSTDKKWIQIEQNINKSEYFSRFKNVNNFKTTKKG